MISHIINDTTRNSSYCNTTNGTASITRTTHPIQLTLSHVREEGYQHNCLCQTSMPPPTNQANESGNIHAQHQDCYGTTSTYIKSKSHRLSVMHIRAESQKEPRYSSGLPYPTDDLHFNAMSEEYCTNMLEPTNYRNFTASYSRKGTSWFSGPASQKKNVR